VAPCVTWRRREDRPSEINARLRDPSGSWGGAPLVHLYSLTSSVSSPYLHHGMSGALQQAFLTPGEREDREQPQGSAYRRGASGCDVSGAPRIEPLLCLFSVLYLRKMKKNAPAGPGVAFKRVRARSPGSYGHVLARTACIPSIPHRRRSDPLHPTVSSNSLRRSGRRLRGSPHDCSR
jgi:hypothetical protein